MEMIKKWMAGNERKTLWLAIVLLLYITYQLSIKKTIEALALNSQMQEEVDKAGTGEQSTALLLEQKNMAYQQLLKAYRVKKEDREQRMWQTISGLAMYNGVQISFTPQLDKTDTISSDHIAKTDFSFKGKYPALIKLLDTLHHTSQIGKIAAVRIATQKNIDQTELLMKVDFVGVEW